MDDMAVDAIETNKNRNIDDMEVQVDPATSRLKSNVTKRKGRGFATSEERTSHLNTLRGFETLEDDDGGRSTAMKSIEGWVIFVTGIHEEASEEDVHDKFADAGQISDLRLPVDNRTGFMKGYALIEYGSYKEAKLAVDELSGTDLLGKTIHCDFAFNREALLVE